MHAAEHGQPASQVTERKNERRARGEGALTPRCSSGVGASSSGQLIPSAPITEATELPRDTRAHVCMKVCHVCASALNGYCGVWPHCVFFGFYLCIDGHIGSSYGPARVGRVRRRTARTCAQPYTESCTKCTTFKLTKQQWLLEKLHCACVTRVYCNCTVWYSSMVLTNNCLIHIVCHTSCVCCTQYGPVRTRDWQVSLGTW